MWGYIGITTAFILLASVLLWILITSRTNVVIKAILISFVMWYGMVLYYTPSNLMGWGKPVETLDLMPDNSRILWFHVKEPDKIDKTPGAIFFTVVVHEQEDGTEITLNPKNAFVHRGNREPRMYKLPYTRSLHKKILEAQRGQEGSPGARLMLRKEKGSKGNDNRIDSEMTIEILNPSDLFKKPTQ